MNISLRRCAPIKKWIAVLALPLIASSAFSAGLDYEVDPTRLGTGEWVYVIKDCVNHMGGSADWVTNAPTMFQFFKKHGVDYVVVKAGTGSRDFPSAENPQFTPELVKQAHAVGIRIFGYSRSDGKDVPGEIALACKVNAMGADGFVIDAEAEWEASRLGDKGPKLAVELCEGIRKAYPTRFLGHAPMPIISKHSSFPYKEFGRYCDTVMPQAYWKSIGVSPKRMVAWMEAEWHDWYKTLQGNWTNAIKPLAPIAQAWSPTSDRVLHGAEIVQFANELKAVKNPASPTGYKSISYWRCDLHTHGMWKAIRRVDMLKESPTDLEQDEKEDLAKLEQQTPAASESASDLILDNNGPFASFEGKWTPGKMKPNRFGSNYECAKSVAGGPNATAIYRPKITKAGKYDVYVWYPSDLPLSGEVPHTLFHAGTSERIMVDQRENGGQWLLIATEKYFEAGTEGYLAISNDLGTNEAIIVADAVRFRQSVVQDDAVVDSAATVPPVQQSTTQTAPEPKPTVAAAEIIVSVNDPNVTLEGNWREGKMSSGFFTENYRWASTVAGAPTAVARFVPDIRVEGTYDIYVWHTVSTNRSRAARWEIECDDGKETVRVNQRRNGGHWFLIAKDKHFSAGRSGFVKLSNDTGERGAGDNIIICDAVRFVLKQEGKMEHGARVAANTEQPKATGPDTVETFVPSERDILVDNSSPDVKFEGKWITATTPGSFGGECVAAATTAGNSTASAVYRPAISIPGDYDVYIWYSQGANRSTNAQWLVSWNGGTAMVNVDQTKNGGQWLLIASGKRFAAGNNGSVALYNDTDDSDRHRKVIADAVRFRLRGTGHELISTAR